MRSGRRKQAERWVRKLRAGTDPLVTRHRAEERGRARSCRRTRLRFNRAERTLAAPLATSIRRDCKSLGSCCWLLFYAADPAYPLDRSEFAGWYHRSRKLLLRSKPSICPTASWARLRTRASPVKGRIGPSTNSQYARCARSGGKPRSASII